MADALKAGLAQLAILGDAEAFDLDDVPGVRALIALVRHATAYAGADALVDHVDGVDHAARLVAGVRDECLHLKVQAQRRLDLDDLAELHVAHGVPRVGVTQDRTIVTTLGL